PRQHQGQPRDDQEESGVDSKEPSQPEGNSEQPETDYRAAQEIAAFLGPAFEPDRRSPRPAGRLQRCAPLQALKKTLPATPRLLNEPTAALDTESERLVIEALVAD